MTGNPPELFRKFFGLFARIFGFVGPFRPLNHMLPWKHLFHQSLRFDKEWEGTQTAQHGQRSRIGQRHFLLPKQIPTLLRPVWTTRGDACRFAAVKSNF